MTVSDALVHVVPIDAAAVKANSLLVIEAQADGPVGLSLERSVDGSWQSVADGGGLNPFVALPVGDKPDPVRLRVWSRDRQALPVTFTVADVDAKTIDEAAILKGAPLAPLAELGGGIGVLHVVRRGQGVLFVDDGQPTLHWSSAANAGVRHAATGQLDGNGRDIWLVGRASSDQPLLKLRAPDMQGWPGRPDCSPVRRGRYGSRAGGGRGGDPLQGRLQGSGQAAVTAAEWDPRLMAFGGPETARVGTTVSLEGTRDIRIRQADGTSRIPDLPVTLSRYAFTLPEAHPLGAALTDGTFAGGDAARFALPDGDKILSLNLPEGTSAVLTKSGKAVSVIWAWQARLFEVPTNADGLILLYTGKGHAAYSLGLHRGMQAPVVWHDTAGTLVLDECCGESLTPLGSVEDMIVVSGSGTVSRGLSPVPAGTGHDPRHVFIDFTPGLMGFEKNLVAALGDDAAPLELTAGVSQTLPVRSVRLQGGPARLVTVHVDAPSVLYTGGAPGDDGTPRIAPKLFDAGGDYFLLMPDGQPRDLMAVPVTTDAHMTLSVLTTTPIGEGMGPKRRVAPGEARAFSFSLPDARTVGAGVRASVDTANCTIVGPDGRQYGGGKLVMQALPAGTSLLVVSVPADSPPVEIEPALVGTKSPDNGPPDDVKAQYLAMVNRKTSP